MITIERIKTANSLEYSFVEELLISAFPVAERRELDLQRDFTDNNPLFHNCVVRHEGNLVGFISYWDFDDFCYVEHFAISPNARNGGYGKKVLLQLEKMLEKPIVLEVELPEDEMSKRRIGFYSRLGYELWNVEYLQPPYRKGDKFLPMHIMVKGELNCEKDYSRIKDKIYKNAYLVS